MMPERLTWSEIKLRYPHQYVGLVDCEPDSTNIDSAIVKYTGNDMTQGEMFRRAVEGEIHMRYTSPEDYPEIASNF